MAFQTPLTIRKALERIERHDLVLPSIQREFVWKPHQICRLFDSLMQGYPVGSFLFWRIEQANVGRYKFYDFALHYHERDRPHCAILEITGGTPVTAVLDGQQRLTAINIGLRGSHATKEPRKWRNSPNAFPEKQLYLNVLGSVADVEEGMRHEFAFLTREAAAERDAQHCWFLVRNILAMNPGIDLFHYVQQHELGHTDAAYARLDRLHRVIHQDQVVAHYEEDSQDLEKVLNIFIRTNSGGTVLSYSDLLLSIATAQWTALDARKEIHALVDQINDERVGFGFSKDFVLKAGLMLCDVASVGFQVANFSPANMAVLEQRWKHVADALLRAVRLIAGFGFSGQNLTADSAVLPVAYYLHRSERDDRYLTHTSYEADRQAVKNWLIRSLLKPGVWGSGLDSTLTAIRSGIKDHGATAFPTAAIDAVLEKRGRSLRFLDAEIQDLADLQYSDRRVFSVLSLLFPFVDLRNEFHIDHVFPISRLKGRKLRADGLSAAAVDRVRDARDRLGNLQLLTSELNISKNDELPAEWLGRAFTSDDSRQDYCRRQLLGDVPATLGGFEAFYDARRTALVTRLTEMLSG